MEEDAVSEPKECCAFCRFSLRWQGPMDRRADYPMEDVVCRRHAPVVQLQGGGHVIPTRRWPSVSNLDWCGDFERTNDDRW